MSDPRTRARSCPACGALNGGDFGQCVRCGIQFGGLGTRVPGLGRYFDGSSLAATKLLGGFVVIVFIGQVLAAMRRGLGFPLMSGGHPADALRFGAVFVEPALVTSEPYRLISAVFVHFGAIHLGMNLLALSNLSRVVEPAVGSARYVLAYVTSGVVSFATTLAYTTLTGGQPSLTAGASGAIFGVMGLILGVLWRRRDPRWKTFAVQAVLFSVVLGFAMNARGSGLLVNNSAHLGGLATGILFGLAFAKRKPRESDALANISAALVLVAVAISLVLPHTSELTREVDREVDGHSTGE